MKSTVLDQVRVAFEYKATFKKKIRATSFFLCGYCHTDLASAVLFDNNDTDASAAYVLVVAVTPQ